MTVINGYYTRTKPYKRSVWLVKPCTRMGRIAMKDLHLPKEYIGKRVRIKIEIVNDEEEEN